MRVWIDGTGLPNGAKYGRIKVRATGETNSPQKVWVTMQALGVGGQRQPSGGYRLSCRTEQPLGAAGGAVGGDRPTSTGSLAAITPECSSVELMVLQDPYSELGGTPWTAVNHAHT